MWPKINSPTPLNLSAPRAILSMWRRNPASPTPRATAQLTEPTMSNLDTTTQADAAASTPVTSATPAETTKRESVAKHELITEPGGEHTSDITKALGIRYVDKASGEKFEFMLPDAIAGHPMTMLALFGAKTKATNEASRVRNGQGGDTTAQFEAIDEVFAN